MDDNRVTVTEEAEVTMASETHLVPATTCAPR